MSTNDGGPAFPVPGNPATMPGMTLRDWFAGQAMAGMSTLKDERVWRSDSGETVSEWRRRIFTEDAQFAYLMADAMLAARERTTT